jgi:hypothetical protein
MLLRMSYADACGVIHEGIRWSTESEFWLLCDPRLIASEVLADMNKPITCLTCLAYLEGGS